MRHFLSRILLVIAVFVAPRAAVANPIVPNGLGTQVTVNEWSAV